MLVFSADRLRSITRAIFVAVGAPDPVAQRVADALVDANLVGHDSHGVIRVPQYVNAVQQGHVIPTAKPEVVRESASYALVNGNWTFGQVSAEFATRLAIAKAKEQKVAAVGVVRCTHIGRLGEYATMAAEEGVLALVMAGGFGGHGAQVAPFGGKGPAFGTNPLSFAAPAGDEPPVLIDFATSAIASGKIQVARAKREPLPPGSIIDRDGRPTTDPEAFYQGGMLLPFGAHKGYGLAFMIDLLGQALTGSRDFAEPGRGGPVYEESGNLILALDASIFRRSDAYTADAQATVKRVRAVPPAEGFREVLVPGDPERRTRLTREQEGIPVPEATWEAITQVAVNLGVAID